MANLPLLARLASVVGARLAFRSEETLMFRAGNIMRSTSHHARVGWEGPTCGSPNFVGLDAGGRYAGGTPAEFRDPQSGPRQLATAVSAEKRSMSKEAKNAKTGTLRQRVTIQMRDH